MGKERQRNRISSKIDALPPDVKAEVDAMLLDSSITYTQISEFLNEEGYVISRSAVGRYALRTNDATSRLQEIQQRTEALVKVAQQNPDLDYTEAGMQFLMDGLINRLAMAEEEFDEMPLDKAGKLVTALSRTKAYKDKVRQDLQSNTEKAFKGMEAEIMAAIKGNKALADEMKSILERAKVAMLESENT